MAKYYQPKGYRFKKGTIKCGDIRLSVFLWLEADGYWWCDDDKIWVKKSHEECQGSSYGTASCPVHSVKAAQRHIKNHPEIEKGTKVILVSRFKGLDVVFTK